MNALVRQIYSSRIDLGLYCSVSEANKVDHLLAQKWVSQLFIGALPDFKTDRVFSHDVTAAILVSQNNETAAMLVSRTNPVGVELFSYANAFFCSNKFA